MATDRNTGITQLGLDYRDGITQITLWAPFAKSVDCKLYNPNGTVPLQKDQYGYWHGESADVEIGQSYHFVVDNEKIFPDPASRSQPQGVHEASQVVDLDYKWRDQHYHMPKTSNLIIYELHVGTFTKEHNFDGVIQKLPHLKDLGINAMELMPVNQFPGERNWGYDGVFPYAVQHSYGGPKELQRFVDACHQEGIAVILDVVYNHFGPEGNYLPHYGPYLTDKYRTPWGEAVNYDDAYNFGVRHYVLENIRMWFEDFHIDGLRLDAVHAIRDFSPTHILQDIRQLTDEISDRTGKSRHLIIECDLNDRKYLDPLSKNGYGMHAQWLDEFHHALRVAIGEPRKGYYTEFAGVKDLAKSYQDAYVFTGNYSTHRHKFFGTDSDDIERHRFVAFSQNHDQVGNRMLGERSSMLYTESKQRLMAMALMMSPFTPLLFMGEEWGARTPFQYFVNHSDSELIEAVQKGRREEFAEFHSEEDVPDPQSSDTFANSTLDWHELKLESHARMMEFYKSLIHFRQTHKLFTNREQLQWQVDCQSEQEIIELHCSDGTNKLLCILNFSKESQKINLATDSKWSKIADSDAQEWGGNTRFSANTIESISAAPFSGLIFESR